MTGSKCSPVARVAVPPQEIAPQATLPAIPQWRLALANAGLILAVYGLLGMVGFWFAQQLGLPGIYRQDSGLRAWVVAPLVIGLVAGTLGRLAVYPLRPGGRGGRSFLV